MWKRCRGLFSKKVASTSQTEINPACFTHTLCEIIGEIFVKIFFVVVALTCPNYLRAGDAIKRQREVTVTTISCSEGAISVGAGADFNAIISMAGLPL